MKKEKERKRTTTIRYYDNNERIHIVKNILQELTFYLARKAL